jgi:hypothetical protein
VFPREIHARWFAATGSESLIVAPAVFVPAAQAAHFLVRANALVPVAEMIAIGPL